MPKEVKIEYSNQAAKQSLTHLSQTTVSPSLNPASTAAATKQLLQVLVKDRRGNVHLARDYYFSLAGLLPGDTIRMGTRTDVSSLPTDEYDFEFKTKTLFADGTESSEETITLDEFVENDAGFLGGNMNTANRPDYGFGAGWGLSGLRGLKESALGTPPGKQGVWLDWGAGEALWFPKATGGH